jgi:branched-chain amino acid transport system ATP-binding protein
MTTNGYIVQIENLFSGYGKKIILNGISVNIEQEKITTLIGRNGVGKTTLLNTFMGLLKPESGRITYRGEDISATKPHTLVSMGISYVPQGKSVFPHMTVSEHMDIGAWTLKEQEAKASMFDVVYKLFPRLKERANQKAGTLSGGERQMLSIGRALMSRPTLLILDEPSFGLAPKLVDAVFNSILEINKDAVTVLVIEQNAKKALENSNFGYVMDMGKIIRQGNSSDLLYDDEIRQSYLGGRKK